MEWECMIFSLEGLFHQGWVFGFLFLDLFGGKKGREEREKEEAGVREL